MPGVTLQCNQSVVLHVYEKMYFYKSKNLALLQTLIKASQHHQKLKKKLFLEHMIKVLVENWWVCQIWSQLPSSTI